MSEELWFWLTDQFTFIVELLVSCLVFLSPLSKRRIFPLRMVLGIAACLGIAALLPHVFLRYALEFVTAAAFVWLCCDVPVWDALYCAVCAYAAQHFAFCFHVELLRMLDLSPVEDYAFRLVTYGGVYLLAYLLIARRLPEGGHYDAGLRRSLLSMAVVLSFTLLLSYYVTSNVLQKGASPYAHVCLFYAMICCAFALWVQVSLRKQTRLAAQVETERRLRRQQQEQYELSRENIDLINRKCHDLKHQVAALRTVRGEAEREASLREIEESVMIYDSVVKTGNQVLDTVLTEKSLLCEKRHISWTCMADGSPLAHMEPVDLYCLFGNALDNAIESVSGIDDPEKRVIAVTLYTRGELSVLQIENYCGHPVSFAGDGLPVTTKTDGDHGYGMRSIRSIVEKYGGSLTVQVDGDIFILSAVLPTP